MIAQARMQRFVDKLVDEEGLECININMKDVKVGRARLKTGNITLPYWLLKHDWPFVAYYLIHEVCHFLHPRKGKGWHDDAFKRTEDEVLKKHGLRIERAKAYARKIYENEKLVWQV